MLPPRLAALKVPTVAAGRVHGPGTVLAPALSPGGGNGSLPTASGLRSALAGPLSRAALGPRVSAGGGGPGTRQGVLSPGGTPVLTPAPATQLVPPAGAPAGPERPRP